MVLLLDQLHGIVAIVDQLHGIVVGPAALFTIYMQICVETRVLHISLGTVVRNWL